MKTYGTIDSLKTMYNAKNQWSYTGSEVFVWETLILNGVDGRAMSFANAQTKALKAFVKGKGDGNLAEDETYEAVRQYFDLSEVQAEFDAFIAKWHEEEVVLQKKAEQNKAFEDKWGFSLNDLANIQDLSISCPTKRAIIKGVVIRLVEEAEYDWTYYAKSYHHPKKTVTGRYVNFWRKRGNKHDRIEIEKFTTSNIIEAVAKYFGAEKASFNKLQTSPYFSIEKRRDCKEYSVCTQTFMGEVVGFVVTDGKTTYHANSQKEAVEGWRTKIAMAKEKKEIKAGIRVTAEILHEKFGFCYAGMREFASECGLDYHKSYTIAEIKKALAVSPQRRTLCVKYKSEIAQMFAR